jgi:hypothetical protein
MNTVASHLLFIDDSGTKEYASSPDLYGTNISRYFVFGGVLIPAGAAGSVTKDIVDAKIHTFGTPDVEIKSNWLRIPCERKARYLDEYDLSEKELSGFVETFYAIVLGADIILLAAVVDKVHMQEDYPNPWYPPAIAYEILLQRVENELSGHGTVGVTIDDMTGATPHGNQYKANLKKQHEQMKQRGSSLRDGVTFSTLEGRLRFVNSAQSHLIQVADIAAYNVFRQFVDHGEDWEKEGLSKLPSYDYFLRIARKFRKGPGGRIQGFGVVKFPLRKRIPWGLAQK